jgi:glycosyltransferase involved in cell wall biosynthesis
VNTPSLSVLIPVFNGEPFLAECLDSVLSQDFTDFEVLISDDASTDGSAAVIERFARRDGRIRWWRNPRNLGIGGNFNACLKPARGEFIKYLLHDDKLIHSSALQRMVVTMQNDPSVSLTVSAARLIDVRSRPIRTRNSFGRSGVCDGKPVIVRCLSENANLIGEPSLALFRRSQATRGFDERLKQLLDLEMWFHLLEQGRFAHIAEPLCAFRQHAGQQTELNVRTAAAVNEPFLMAERYLAKPWMKTAATPKMIFRQLYVLRQAYGEKASPLLADLAKSLDPGQYAAHWLRYKLNRPFHKCRQWLEKRRILN